MQISFRDLITVLHGMGFGALFMLAFSGAIAVIYSSAEVGTSAQPSYGRSAMFRFYLVSMALLAWLSVLSGAYVIYPWYRAVPPPGTTDLAPYPQRLLMSSKLTIGWHDLGMEWKEHIAWFAPIAMTAPSSPASARFVTRCLASPPRHSLRRRSPARSAPC